VNSHPPLYAPEQRAPRFARSKNELSLAILDSDRLSQSGLRFVGSEIPQKRAYVGGHHRNRCLTNAILSIILNYQLTRSSPHCGLRPPPPPPLRPYGLPFRPKSLRLQPAAAGRRGSSVERRVPQSGQRTTRLRTTRLPPPALHLWSSPPFSVLLTKRPAHAKARNREEKDQALLTPATLKMQRRKVPKQDFLCLSLRLFVCFA